MTGRVPRSSSFVLVNISAEDPYIGHRCNMLEALPCRPLAWWLRSFFSLIIVAPLDPKYRYWALRQKHAACDRVKHSVDGVKV